ncbi:MAG: protein serine/threonine phosphatase 2C family protein [Oligoflexales bacterium]|nr:protein serine/threonine phosphatase 2C family protein [Oligoflexales bacterium]
MHCPYGKNAYRLWQLTISLLQISHLASAAHFNALKSLTWIPSLPKLQWPSFAFGKPSNLVNSTVAYEEAPILSSECLNRKVQAKVVKGNPLMKNMVILISLATWTSTGMSIPRVKPSLIKSVWKQGVRRFSGKADDLKKLCGISQFQNRRAYQEDRYFIGTLDHQTVYAGVCDGHGGDSAADLGSRIFPVKLKEYWNTDQNTESILKLSVKSTEEEILAEQEEQDEKLCGSTLTAAIISPTHVHLVQLGDSAAIGLKEEQCFTLSTEHKPENSTDKARIEEEGGSVIEAFGAKRLMGTLAISRSLGNISLKDHGLSAEPDITSIPRTKELTVLILGTDGLTEGLSLEEIKELLYECKTAEEAAEKLTMEATWMSEDNITTIVVPLFKWQPKVSPSWGEWSCIREST